MKSKSVAYVTFNTPKSLNSITEERPDDLEQAVAAVREDQNVRALVLTGNGRAFCVGLDLAFLKRAFYDIQLFERTIRRLGKILLDFEDLPVPVIAAVNGVARAGGFEIALAADLMLIAEEAQIGDNHTQVGVMPGGACLHRLRERVGEQCAKDIVWYESSINSRVNAALLASRRLSQMLPRRLRSHAKVNQSTAVILDDDEHVQDTERAGHKPDERSWRTHSARRNHAATTEAGRSRGRDRIFADHNRNDQTCAYIGITTLARAPSIVALGTTISRFLFKRRTLLVTFLPYFNILIAAYGPKDAVVCGEPPPQLPVAQTSSY